MNFIKKKWKKNGKLFFLIYPDIIAIVGDEFLCFVILSGYLHFE
jgi:hypothetical protein